MKGFGHLAVVMLISIAMIYLALVFRWAAYLWIAAALGTVCATVETWLVRPEMFDAIVRRPLGWACVLLTGAGAAAIWSGIRGNGERRLFLGSCALITGLLGGAAVGLFPEMLHSTLDPRFSLTAQTGATARSGLTAGLYWWPFALVLAIVYAVGISRAFRGKV